MAAATACFSTSPGWSLSPGIPWSVCSGIVVHFTPELGGHFHRNLHINEEGKFLTLGVAMRPHAGYQTFDELKSAFIKAMDSPDDGLLKEFAEKVAPSEHLLYYLPQNVFSQQSMNNTNIDAIKEKYIRDLSKFKQFRWKQQNPGIRYERTILTHVPDYTLQQRGVVTNLRRLEHAYGDNKFLEKLLRNAIKVNGYWISSYFMLRNFERFEP